MHPVKMVEAHAPAFVLCSQQRAAVLTAGRAADGGGGPEAVLYWRRRPQPAASRQAPKGDIGLGCL